MVNKETLRQEVKIKRSELLNNKKYKQYIEEQIFLFLQNILPNHGCIALYNALESEINISSIWKFVLEKGCRTVFPRVSENFSLDLCIAGDVKDFRRGSFGILEPCSSVYKGSVDIFLVPGLAFGVDGSRLGYGAGYYDRLLSKYPNAQKIGITAEEFLYQHLPQDKYDITMDCIVSERKIIDI
ncbi:MAG: 5-formyltetrahydrofolate cyclo-ligase [Brevinemataceae bacterium]